MHTDAALLCAALINGPLAIAQTVPGLVACEIDDVDDVDSVDGVDEVDAIFRVVRTRNIRWS